MKHKLFLLSASSAFLVLVSGCGGDSASYLKAGQEAYAIHDLNKAARSFESCLEVATNNVEAMLRLALVRLELGELPEASKLTARARELAGEDEDVRLLSAQVAWHVKDYALARKLYGELAQQGADAALKARGWTGLGLVDWMEERRDSARLAFLRAIRLDRRNPSARYHLGLLYRDLGYHTAALEQFEVFVHHTQEADVRVQRVQRNQIRELKDLIARTAAECPGSDKRNSAASASALQAAAAEWKKGNFKTARTRYDEAYKADVLSYQAALGLAKAWEKTDATVEGQKQALKYYRAACVLSPSAVSSFLTAGALAMKLDFPVQAVEFYSRAVAANPASLDAIDGLIRALRKTGVKANVATALEYQAFRDWLTRKN